MGSSQGLHPMVTIVLCRFWASLRIMEAEVQAMFTWDDIRGIASFVFTCLGIVVGLYLAWQVGFFILGGVGYAFETYGNVLVPFVLVPTLGVLGSMWLSSLKNKAVEVKPEPPVEAKAEQVILAEPEPVLIPIPETNLSEAEYWVKVRLGYFIRNGCVAPSGRPATKNELRGMQDYLYAFLHGQSAQQRNNAIAQAFGQPDMEKVA